MTLSTVEVLELTLAPADMARVWTLAFRAPLRVTMLEAGGVVFFMSPADRRGCGDGGLDFRIRKIYVNTRHLERAKSKYSTYNRKTYHYQVNYYVRSCDTKIYDSKKFRNNIIFK